MEEPGTDRARVHRPDARRHVRPRDAAQRSRGRVRRVPETGDWWNDLYRDDATKPAKQPPADDEPDDAPDGPGWFAPQPDYYPHPPPPAPLPPAPARAPAPPRPKTPP